MYYCRISFFASQISMFYVPSTPFFFTFDVMTICSSTTDYTHNLAAPQCLYFEKTYTICEKKISLKVFTL